MQLTFTHQAPFTTIAERTGHVFERRGLYALHNDTPIGFLRVGRVISGAAPDDKRYRGPDGDPLTYICHRETFQRLDDVRLGTLIIPEAHKRWHEELGSIHSGYLFAREEAKNVWRRLTRNQRAEYVPFTHNNHVYDRWRLLE